MKQLFRLLLGILIGAAIGFGGVMFTMWLVDGNTPSVGKKDIDWALLGLSVGAAVVALVVAVFVHLILHEAGHLVAGLLTGFRFVSFRIFKYTLAKTPDGLRWKQFHMEGTGGQCILELPEDQDPARAPWFWYNAGGVMMNVAIILLSVVVLRLTGARMLLPYAFLVMLVFVGIFMVLMNGIPMVVGGVSNDAHNLWLLWRRPHDRMLFVRSLQAAGGLSRGKRLGEMPAEWMASSPATPESDYMELSASLLHMEWLEDLGRYDEARQVAEEVMALDKKLPVLLKLETGGERVMLELLTTNRREVVEELWTKQLAHYTMANSKYSPIKCAVLYAYELLFNLDAQRADSYRQQLEEHQADYMMPGEARTAISLVEACLRMKDSNK